MEKKKKKKIVINLIDFGYCEIAHHDFVVQQGMIKGTAGYIAPEILTEFKYSKKSDLYAIGCIGFEMITGGRLPNEYNARGQYIGDGIVSDDEKFEPTQVTRTTAGFDVDLEQILRRETADR